MVKNRGEEVLVAVKGAQAAFFSCDGTESVDRTRVFAAVRVGGLDNQTGSSSRGLSRVPTIACEVTRMATFGATRSKWTRGIVSS